MASDATATMDSSKTAPPKARPIRLINFIAYGSNDFLGAGSMAVISGWVLIFYTKFCGLSAGQAAAIFAIARILDAFTSPVIGHLSDHFGGTWLGRTFGRRRFFILAAIPLLPAFALMWLPGQAFLYYLVTYILFEMVYAMEIIPFETLAAEMSTSYRDKTKFAGFRIFTGQIAAILAGFMPMWLIDYLGRDSAWTFLYMGAIFAVLFMATAGFLYAFSWERQRPARDPDETPAERIGFVETFTTLYRNLFSTMRIRAFRLHLGMYLGGYISQDIFNAAFTFFVIFALAGTTALASGLLGWMYVVQLVAVAIAINVALRSSPGRAYRIAAISFGVGTAILIAQWMAGVRGDSWMLWIPIVFAGLGRGALNYIPWATYNYMADVDEIVTGQRREGSFAGVMTFIRKAAQAAAVAGVGLIMDWGGFQSKAAVQSPHAIHVMVWVLGAGTLTVLVFGILVSLRFRIDPQTHRILMEEIEHLRTGATEPTSPHAREIVENLSGWRYDQLWGRAMRGA